MIISYNSLPVVLKLCYLLESPGKPFFFFFNPNAQSIPHMHYIRISEGRTQASVFFETPGQIRSMDKLYMGEPGSRVWKKGHSERSSGSQWSKSMHTGSMCKQRTESVSPSRLGVAVRHRPPPTPWRRLACDKSPGGKKECFPIHHSRRNCPC